MELAAFADIYGSPLAGGHSATRWFLPGPSWKYSKSDFAQAIM